MFIHVWAKLPEIYVMMMMMMITWPDIQGGPAKVRPTYIFDGNIW